MTWYVVRVAHKNGNVGYLGVDAVGNYLPANLPDALNFPANERHQAMDANVIKFFIEHGSTVDWCRIELVPEKEPEPTPTPSVVPDA